MKEDMRDEEEEIENLIEREEDMPGGMKKDETEQKPENKMEPSTFR